MSHSFIVITCPSQSSAVEPFRKLRHVCTIYDHPASIRYKIPSWTFLPRSPPSPPPQAILAGSLGGAGIVFMDSRHCRLTRPVGKAIESGRELKQWRRVWAFLRPQQTTSGVRELTTLSSLIGCKGNSNSSQNRRSRFRWPDRWPHKPAKAILGSHGWATSHCRWPSVPGPPNVFKQIKSDYDKQ